MHIQNKGAEPGHERAKRSTRRLHRQSTVITQAPPVSQAFWPLQWCRLSKMAAWSNVAAMCHCRFFPPLKIPNSSQFPIFLHFPPFFLEAIWQQPASTPFLGPFRGFWTENNHFSTENTKNFPSIFPIPPKIVQFLDSVPVRCWSREEDGGI